MKDLKCGGYEQEYLKEKNKSDNIKVELDIKIIKNFEDGDAVKLTDKNGETLHIFHHAAISFFKNCNK